jgi:predicted nucleic acid-binding protein
MTQHSAEIHRTVSVADLLIATTAIDLGLAAVTQDDDFNQPAVVHQGLTV